MSPAPETMSVIADDGWALSLSVFEPAAGGGGRAVLVIAPAMGAPARIYRELAGFMADRGYPSVVFDPRGCGASTPLPSRAVDYGVDAFIYRDWPAMIAWTRRRYPDRPLVLIGHSLGGHLSAIHAGLNPDQVRGLVLLTTSHVHYRGWGFPLGLGAWANFVLFAAIARALGYLPGHRLGWGSPIARQVILDWARWGLSGRYRGTRGQDLDAALARVRAPVLAVSFTDDTRLAPKRPVDRFVARLGNAPVSRWHLSPGEVAKERVGHLGHLRECPGLWQRIDVWLRENVASDANGA